MPFFVRKLRVQLYLLGFKHLLHLVLSGKTSTQQGKTGLTVSHVQEARMKPDDETMCTVASPLTASRLTIKLLTELPPLQAMPQPATGIFLVHTLLTLP